MFRSLLFILITLLVVSIILVSSAYATGGSFDRPKPKSTPIGKFVINGEIVSIDNALTMRHVYGYELVQCSINFYSLYMMWGEHVRIGTTHCQTGSDEFHAFDDYGKVWDF